MLKPSLAILLCGLAALPAAPVSVSAADESDQGVNIKYMYYWDRNKVWNHTPAIA